MPEENLPEPPKLRYWSVRNHLGFEMRRFETNTNIDPLLAHSIESNAPIQRLRDAGWYAVELDSAGWPMVAPEAVHDPMTEEHAHLVTTNLAKSHIILDPKTNRCMCGHYGHSVIACADVLSAVSRIEGMLPRLMQEETTADHVHGCGVVNIGKLVIVLKHYTVDMGQKRFDVIINGRNYKIGAEHGFATYETLCHFIWSVFPELKNCTQPTITWDRGPMPKISGSLTPGGRLVLKDGMRINAFNTNNA